MTASSQTPTSASASTPAPSLDVTGVGAEDRSALIAWLDDGLRDGRRGRLEAEYPISLGPSTIDAHRVVYDVDQPISHAMYHLVTVRAPMPIAVGMIGLVYTERDSRGQGQARRCIESCCEALEYQGAVIALLWSDKPAFYARLGFHPFGTEKRWLVDADLCVAARRGVGSPDNQRALMLDSPRVCDWREMEMLYADKSFRVDREPGALEALAAAPETICVVARYEGRVVAYAALGRGDDFRGVVHEWAGAASDVLACFAALSAECGPLLVQAGPDPGPIAQALEVAGARSSLDSFALARVLDATRPPPSSLYLWGFDSI